MGLTLAGVTLGIIGALSLFAWVSDAASGPRPTLAAATHPAVDPDRVETIDDTTPASETTTTTTSTRAPLALCSAVAVDEPAVAESEVQHLQADLRAEGCSRTVSWSPVSAQATIEWPEGVRRYALGQPGDQLVLGDWDADGRATPALYRPSTGETFTFSGWAEPGAELPSQDAADTGIRDGHAVARTAVPGTADQLVVEDP